MPNKLIPPKTTTATRTSATPLDGELFYDTDEKSYYQGDGVTQGGKPLGKNEFKDDQFRIQDNTDTTKQIAFEVSGITTGTTRTLTAPDTNGTFALIDTTGLSDKDLFYYNASSKLFKRIAIGTENQALVAKPESDPPYQFTTLSGGGGGVSSFTVITSNTTFTDSNNYLVPVSGVSADFTIDTSTTVSPQGKTIEICNENSTYKPCIAGINSLDGVSISPNKGIYINTSGKKGKFLLTSSSKDARQLWGDTPTIDWIPGYIPPQPEGTLIAMHLNNSLAEYNGLTVTNTGLTFDTSIKPNSNWTATLKYTTSSQKLTVPYSVSHNIGSSSFCLEYLIYFNQQTDFAYTGNLDSDAQYPMIRHNYNANAATLWGTGGTWSVANDPQAPSSMSVNTWHHVALTRSGTTATLYIDGVAVDTATISSTLPTTANKPWHIILGAYNQTMYLANYRLVVGQVIYTSNFTPNFDPFTY